MDAATAKARGLTPLARILGYTSFAQAPEWFTTAPAGAIQKLLAQLGWKAGDVDLYEVNEAFAAVTMAAMRDVGFDHARTNVNGGACALGHPIGATGARIIATLVHALRARGGGRGIASLCIGGGEATAIAVEVPRERMPDVRRPAPLCLRPRRRNPAGHMKIADARAVVTGGASGLGNAVARHIVSRRRPRVFVRRAGRSRPRPRPRLGGRASFAKCDVTSETEVNAAMDSAREAMGGINLLVNCAGVIGAGSRTRQERPHGRRLLHARGAHQSHRHLPLRQGRRGHHAGQHAQCRWRTRRDHPHLFRRGFRRPDRPGRVLRHQGRSRRA